MRIYPLFILNLSLGCMKLSTSLRTKYSHLVNTQHSFKTPFICLSSVSLTPRPTAPRSAAWISPVSRFRHNSLSRTNRIQRAKAFTFDRPGESRERDNDSHNSMGFFARGVSVLAYSMPQLEGINTRIPE